MDHIMYILYIHTIIKQKDLAKNQLNLIFVIHLYTIYTILLKWYWIAWTLLCNNHTGVWCVFIESIDSILTANNFKPLPEPSQC